MESVFEYVKNSWLNCYNFRLPECEGGALSMPLSRVAMTTNSVPMVTSPVTMVTTVSLSKYNKGVEPVARCHSNQPRSHGNQLCLHGYYCGTCTD